eukprot:gb/GECG01006365.1/.p1 GENE.gb/GECG01006365.1/~~gb/GECG01006365.1/.p1  ORF type:complete len:530 (+),score=61.11 gb/GECG01006365.1/:1-1590(+)
MSTSGSSAHRGTVGEGKASVVGKAAIKQKIGKSKVVQPGSFEPENHFYPRVLNAQVHPMVSSFFSLGNERIIARYCHMHPDVEPQHLRDILNYRPQHFRWAGCDTFNVVSHRGRRQVVVIETNSCPSGQKSMPLLRDTEEEGGYRRLLETTFSDLLKEIHEDSCSVPDGVLAVVYDKNPMEASGYAAVMADLSKEHVYQVEYYLTDPDPPVRWVDDCQVMEIRTAEGEWKPVRAAFRYVTQRPWTRFPVVSKTKVLNPILPCLAGGRNKLVAAKAYDIYNGELEAKGINLRIHTPDTVQVSKAEVPLYVRSFGGQAVIKVPYSNAGQGVYTILSQRELDDFMAENHYYDKFIIQSLVGNSKWSSTQKEGCFYHVGTVPNKRGEIFVADVRMMVASTDHGYTPMAVYARRAHEPLLDKIDDKTFSWGMLGTNLSKMTDDLTWTTESERLLLMDRKDFNSLGIGIDDLIEAYVQTVLSAIAIDKMCKRLVFENDKGEKVFNQELFNSINDDPMLLEELFDTRRKVAAAKAE